MRISKKSQKFSQAMSDQRGLVASLDNLSKQSYQNKLSSLIAGAEREVRRHKTEGRPLVRKAAK